MSKYVIKHEISRHYKKLMSKGFYLRSTDTGMVNIDFFEDYEPYPNTLTYETDKPVVIEENEYSQIREIHTGVILPIAMIPELIKRLQDHLDIFTSPANDNGESDEQ